MSWWIKTKRGKVAHHVNRFSVGDHFSLTLCGRSTRNADYEVAKNKPSCKVCVRLLGYKEATP